MKGAFLMAKKKKKTRPLRVIGTLVLIFLLGSFCYTYINQEMVLKQQEEQIRQMKAENARLEEAYQQRLSEIQDQTTLEHIEKYMRSHFGMLKEAKSA